MGGAVYLADNSESKFFLNEFEDNLAIDGGAIFNGGTLDLIDSKCSGNFAENSVSELELAHFLI